MSCTSGRPANVRSAPPGSPTRARAVTAGRFPSRQLLVVELARCEVRLLAGWGLVVGGLELLAGEVDPSDWRAFASQRRSRPATSQHVGALAIASSHRLISEGCSADPSGLSGLTGQSLHPGPPTPRARPPCDYARHQAKQPAQRPTGQVPCCAVSLSLTSVGVARGRRCGGRGRRPDPESHKPRRTRRTSPIQP